MNVSTYSVEQNREAVLRGAVDDGGRAVCIEKWRDGRSPCTVGEWVQMSEGGGDGRLYIKFHGRLSPAIVFAEFDLRRGEAVSENPETRVRAPLASTLCSLGHTHEQHNIIFLNIYIYIIYGYHVQYYDDNIFFFKYIINKKI